MRWVLSATFLFLLSASGITWKLYSDTQKLNALCEALPSGLDLLHVRNLANKHGFEAELGAHSQMWLRSPSWSWHLNPPSCRVFFNQERTMAYRIWQGR